MLKVAVIGLGNAGNQIAKLAFSEKQIPGFAINSSDKDLSCVQGIDKLVIGDSKGAGKDRTVAKEFLKMKFKEVLEVSGSGNKNPLTTFIDENEVFFIVSSIGGGSGSGMAPMFTDIVKRKYPNKTFVLVEVYPPLSEGIGNQQNGVEFLQEVQRNLPSVTYMCYDNHRRNNLQTTKMMESVNQEIIEHISIIRGDYQYATPYNSIDEKDMLRLLNTPGRLAVYTASGMKEKDLDNKSLEDYIMQDIKELSSNVELDRDKNIKRLGVIVNLNDTLNNEFNSEVPTIREFVGEPVESFEHIYVSKDAPCRVVTILSGLSLPNDRLVKINQRIEEGLEKLNKIDKENILGEIDIESVSKLRSDQGHSTLVDYDSVFDKY